MFMVIFMRSFGGRSISGGQEALSVDTSCLGGVRSIALVHGLIGLLDRLICVKSLCLSILLLVRLGIEEHLESFLDVFPLCPLHVRKVIGSALHFR